MVAQERATSRSYGDQFASDTNTVNLYVQDQVAVGPHRALAAVGYTDHETAGDAWTWNLEYGFMLADSTLLYGLGGTGYRVPDATDRYGYGGNPDLVPERSFDLEAGIRHRFSGAQAVSLAWFRNEIDELIVWAADPGDPYSGQLETSTRRASKASRQRGNTQRDRGRRGSRRYTRSPQPDHRRAPARRAEDSLTINASRRFGPVDLGVDLLATGERKDFGYPEPVTLSSYVLLNLTARWRATPALTLSARLENALNEQYELADNYNTPDRGLYVTVGYSMGAGNQLARVAERRSGDSAGSRSAYSRQAA